MIKQGLGPDLEGGDERDLECQEVQDKHMSDFAGFNDDPINDATLRRTDHSGHDPANEGEQMAAIDCGDDDMEELEGFSEKEWEVFAAILCDDPKRKRWHIKASKNDPYALEVELRRKLKGSNRRKRSPIPSSAKLDTIRQQARRVKMLACWPELDAQLDQCVKTRRQGIQSLHDVTPQLKPRSRVPQ